MTAMCHASGPLFYIIFALIAGCQAAIPVQERAELSRPEIDRLRQKINALLHEGDNECDLHDFDAAIRTYSKVCELDSRECRVYWRIAIAAEKAGRPQIGIDALQILVQVDPTLEDDQEVKDVARSLITMRNRK